MREAQLRVDATEKILSLNLELHFQMNTDFQPATETMTILRNKYYKHEKIPPRSWSTKNIKTYNSGNNFRLLVTKFLL
jgi:hypothetical protein